MEQKRRRIKKIETTTDSLYKGVATFLSDLNDQENRILTDYKLTKKNSPEEFDVLDESTLGKLQNDRLKLLGENNKTKLEVLKLHQRVISDDYMSKLNTIPDDDNDTEENDVLGGMISADAMKQIRDSIKSEGTNEEFKID
jgi:hypothetical protein